MAPSLAFHTNNQDISTVVVHLVYFYVYMCALTMFQLQHFIFIFGSFYQNGYSIYIESIDIFSINNFFFILETIHTDLLFIIVKKRREMKIKI